MALAGGAGKQELPKREADVFRSIVKHYETKPYEKWRKYDDDDDDDDGSEDHGNRTPMAQNGKACLSYIMGECHH